MADKDERDWIKIFEPWRLEKETTITSQIKEPIRTPTEQELYDLTKEEQIDILKKSGITDIPRYEKDRVNKILEIMKQGGD